MIAQLTQDYIRTSPLSAVKRLLSYGLFEGRPLTTKGQWINPLIMRQFALVKRLPKLGTPSAPIFILGTGRSGTTILGQVLSMHRGVGFLNEPKALWFSINPLDDLIGSYSRGEARYLLDERDATEEVKRSAHQLYGFYRMLTGSPRVVDKYPEMIFRVPYLKAIFPDAKFIFLVRNGWDTVQSIEHWSQRLGEQVKGEKHDWWGANNRKWRLLIAQVASQDRLLAPHLDEIKTFTRHEDMAAVEWVLTMRKGLEVAKKFRESVYVLNYEELTETPRETCLALTEFFGLDVDPRFLAYAERTLRVGSVKKPVSLEPAITQAFYDTMDRLGYT